MTPFSPVHLDPKKDQDALLILVLSSMILLLTGGIFYVFMLLFVLHKAKHSPTTSHTAGAVYLVFGKKLIQNKPDLEYQTRLNRLLACHYQHAILMGGKTANSSISEAQAGYEYLSSKQPSVRNIQLEDNSRNTLENLKNTRQLLTKQDNIIIISNRYHLTRCSVLASSLGISHQLCAAENSFCFNFIQLLKFIQEAFYLHWFFTGKYWAKITKNQRMLKKIS